MSAPVTHIFLTGGLGNQLFQLAAALDLSKDGQVIIYDKIGRPRLNNSNLPEIESLLLPPKVKLKVITKPNHFISKVIGFNLRSGFNPTRLEKACKGVLLLASNLLMTIYFRQKTIVQKSSSLGYDEDIRQIKTHNLLVGYFQTYKYLDHLGINNFVKFSKTMPTVVSYFLELSELEKPLVVHVRLGDYVKEDQIGILSNSYYESALRQLWDEERYGKIWLFSDEPEVAITRIPLDLRNHLRIVESEGLSSIETLEIMSFGHGFIIANSSFGWWGAVLRRNPTADVCAPTPWFKKLEEPRDIVPPNWKRIRGFDSVE